MSASYSEGTVAAASGSCMHGDCRCASFPAFNPTAMIDALMLTGSGEQCSAAIRDKHQQLFLSPTLSPRASTRCAQCDCITGASATRTLDLRRNRSVGSKVQPVPFVPWMSTQNLSEARQPVLSWQNGTKSYPQQQGVGHCTGIDTRRVAQHKVASNSLDGELFNSDTATSAYDVRSDRYSTHDQSLTSLKSASAQFAGGRRDRERGGSSTLLARSSSEAHGKSRTMSKLLLGRSESTRRVGHMSDNSLNAPMSPSPKQLSKNFLSKPAPRSPRSSNGSKDMAVEGGGSISQRDACASSGRCDGAHGATVGLGDVSASSAPSLHSAATGHCARLQPPPPPPPRTVTSTPAAPADSGNSATDSASRPSVLMLVADLENKTATCSLSFPSFGQQPSRPADSGVGGQTQGSL